MTAADYAAQNALGFEGDTFLKAEIQRLVDKHEVKAIVETGTYMGATTLQFSHMVKCVVTVESEKTHFDAAFKMLQDHMPKDSDIYCHIGSSVDYLKKMIGRAWYHGSVLIFLDAHWGENNPLLQELAIIAETGIKPIIAIHDFKVPDRPELGFDTYGGQDYEWSWIADSIDRIYGAEGYTYHYNSEATGAKRGVVFIEPNRNE